VNITYDNIIFSLQKAGGISVYWHEMIRRLAEHSCNPSFIEQDSVHTNIFRQKLQLPPEIVVQSKRGSRFLNRYLNPSVKLDPGTIFHSSYYRTCPDPQIVNIITVYDFIYERYRPGLARFVHHAQKKRAILNADGIICISDSTKRDLLRYFPDTPENKIITIHLSAAAEYKQIRVPEDISAEFLGLMGREIILYIGDRSGYKNFDIAVETVQHCKDAMLVAVGGGPFAKNESTRVETALKGRFSHFASLDNSRLNQLYNMALCLLYPSSYEGFGIPALEAMQAGCPVVAANCSSLPEVCGEAGIMVTEISAESFAEKIGQLTNSQFRDDVVQRGLRQSEKFSWDRAFRETIEFYTVIHAQKCGPPP
jgi:glycosyltransferase involved in cell wall biosynthesis